MNRNSKRKLSKAMQYKMNTSDLWNRQQRGSKVSFKYFNKQKSHGSNSKLVGMAWRK